MRLTGIEYPKWMRVAGLVLLSPLLAGTALLLAPPLFIAFGLAQIFHWKRKYISPRDGWQTWFAWHPVPLLDPVFENYNDTFRDWVWLETVSRVYPYKYSKLRYARPRDVEAINKRWDRSDD